MGNVRMRTTSKPIQEKDIPRLVRNSVEYVLQEQIHGRRREITFKETYVWEQQSSLDDPYHTKITCYGNTRFQRAFAMYEGKYGVWEVLLVALTGIRDNPKQSVCKTYGTPRCISPSDQWKIPFKEQLRKMILAGKI